ncbi:hypothetical protein BAY59_29205 [Prauserella coralliicola]|nr:hypothetical protein BAY59_29205 [Prauserella coralliicola]
MSTTHLYVLGGLALVGAFALWRSGRKSATRARKGVREVTRLTANVVRTLVTAAVIVAAQWLVIVKVAHPTATAVALIVPALFAGAAVARLLAVTEIVTTTRGGGYR